MKIYAGKMEATNAFFEHRVLSLVETTNAGFGVLYYKNGSNRGEIKFMRLERQEQHRLYHGLRYWKWLLSGGRDLTMDEWGIKDFCVLLPKRILGAEVGDYTIVTKEWSPMMLEHYEYSKVGLDVKPKLEDLNEIITI